MLPEFTLCARRHLGHYQITHAIFRQKDTETHNYKMQKLSDKVEERIFFFFHNQVQPTELGMILDAE